MLVMGMGTRGYGYNQIRIHITMGSQIPVYDTHGYPFNYPSRARDGFYPRVPVGIGIFATPNCSQHEYLCIRLTCP